MFNLSPVPVPDLSGRVVLVTGAGKGIGAELVRILVAKGAKVFAGIYPGEAAEALPAAAVVLALDVTKQADVDAAVARVQAESGRLDVLVNNAGVIAPIGPLDAVPSDALGAAFAIVLGATSTAVPPAFAPYLLSASAFAGGLLVKKQLLEVEGIFVNR